MIMLSTRTRTPRLIVNLRRSIPMGSVTGQHSARSGARSPITPLGRPSRADGAQHVVDPLGDLADGLITRATTIVS
jgi:hypothetical protein